MVFIHYSIKLSTSLLKPQNYAVYLCTKHEEIAKQSPKIRTLSIMEEH